MRLIFQVVIFMCIAVASAVATTYVAVVETVSSQGVLSRDEKNFVTDRLRERANKVLPEYLGYVIMTRENINAMLPPGKAIEDCEGSCLVETGRNINANYIAQARVGKFGESFTLTVEFYETKSNKLVDSFTAREQKLDGLLDAVDSKADSLFARILQPVTIVNENSFSIKHVTESEKSTAVKLQNKLAGKSTDIPWVVIGSQVWMKKNLNVKTPNSWCYEHDAENCEKYGRLYTWDDAMNACPAGWHLPSVEEWNLLFKNVGGRGIAGKTLKSTNGWAKEGNGSDDYGFSVLPAGFRLSRDFGGVGSNAYFWTSSDSNRHAFIKDFSYSHKFASELDHDKGNGYSVRCILN